MDESFAPSQGNDDVLFHLPATKNWIYQLILGLVLICHSSYRGVVELLRDLFDTSISVGTVPNRLHLLRSVDHRDEDTWGFHLLDVIAQGFGPDYTIADGGSAVGRGLAKEQ